MLITKNIDVSYIDNLLLKDDQLQVVDASVIDDIPHEHIMLWCHKKGIYCLPTTELIDWLGKHIDQSTIEIGSGNGAVGRALGIPMTDSRLMESPEVAMLYKLQGQPITTYGEDVERLDAVSAIKKYKPNTVIGCWVTHKYREDEHDRGGNMWGIDEDFILDNVKRYIVVGNRNVHDKKRILQRSDVRVTIRQFSWVRSRASKPELDAIYVWDRE